MGGADHYLIFETAGGFCGIAWNSVGITRFQLPTKSATATERILLRQAADSDEVAWAFRDDVARDYEMMSPGWAPR